MIVVADSSPFIVLVMDGQIEVLPALFGRLGIPPEVESKLADSKRPPEDRSFITARPPWLDVHPVASPERIEGLHLGETAAIALAQSCTNWVETQPTQLASTIRREEWSKASVLIAVSGYGEEQARDRSKMAGFHHHLFKPVNFDTILTLIGGP